MTTVLHTSPVLTCTPATSTTGRSIRLSSGSSEISSRKHLLEKIKSSLCSRSRGMALKRVTRPNTAPKKRRSGGEPLAAVSDLTRRESNPRPPGPLAMFSTSTPTGQKYYHNVKKSSCELKATVKTSCTSVTSRTGLTPSLTTYLASGFAEVLASFVQCFQSSVYFVNTYPFRGANWRPIFKRAPALGSILY